jgi:hypothetical protein
MLATLQIAQSIQTYTISANARRDRWYTHEPRVHTTTESVAATPRSVSCLSLWVHPKSLYTL